MLAVKCPVHEQIVQRYFRFVEIVFGVRLLELGKGYRVLGGEFPRLCQRGLVGVRGLIGKRYVENVVRFVKRDAWYGPRYRRLGGVDLALTHASQQSQDEAQNCERGTQEHRCAESESSVQNSSAK